MRDAANNSNSSNCEPNSEQQLWTPHATPARGQFGKALGSADEEQSSLLLRDSYEWWLVAFSALAGLCQTVYPYDGENVDARADYVGSSTIGGIPPSVLGGVFGCSPLCAGLLVSSCGPRAAIGWAARVAVVGSLLPPVFLMNPPLFYIGRVLVGGALGVFSAVVPMYMLSPPMYMLSLCVHHVSPARTAGTTRTSRPRRSEGR